MMHYRLFDTAIGACGIAWSERGLTRLALPEADRGATSSACAGALRGRAKRRRQRSIS